MSHDDNMSLDVYTKEVLALDPESAVAIKRDVHNIDVDASAADMMQAFASTMAAPGKMFGLIEVLRTRDKVGHPFAVGERFQGRYSIDAAAMESLKSLSSSALLRGVAGILKALDPVFDAAENLMLSDYGVITDIDLTPPYRLRYEYLEGTPIAGSLTIECHDTGPGRCRFTQTSEYQEAGIEVVVLFGTEVLKMHNRVFYEEVRQSADRIGAHILGSDIPEQYLR